MKKVLYFLPAIIVAISVIFVALIDGLSLDSDAWLYLALPILSGVFLSFKKWWGCILGIAIGILIIYSSTQGEIHIINEMPIGIFVCVYYVVMGYVCYKSKSKKENENG